LLNIIFGYFYFQRFNLGKNKIFKLHPNDDKDVIELRKKHFYSKHMDIVNQLLIERRRLKMGRGRMTQVSSPKKEYSGMPRSIKLLLQSFKYCL
jgi:hypothetical protein